MKELVRRLAPALACDAVGILGAALIAYGAWLVYEPAGFVVSGIELLAAAWLGARSRT
jgi:hypothetical protein